MAFFVNYDRVNSGSYGLAAHSNCRDCGKTQHYDCTGEYIMPCPFNNGPAPRRRNREGGNTQIANVVINGGSYGVSQGDSQRSRRHHGGDSSRSQNDDITRWPCRDCDGNHKGHKDYKGLCLSIMDVDPYKKRENAHKAAVGRMTWRTTGKVDKSAKKSSRPVSVIACDRDGGSRKHSGRGVIVDNPPITPPRRTRPASTRAPRRPSRNGGNGGNGLNIVQIMQVQNSQSRNGGGTGPLARGGAGGFGLRQKAVGVPYVIRGQRQVTQRVNPSSFVVFR
jgi:hypothetical protein